LFRSLREMRDCRQVMCPNMSPELHRMKAQRIETSMQKLSDLDYEAVIEGSMLAGSHWLNFACHRMELTGPGTDVMHAEYLGGAQRVEISLRAPELLHAMDEIEAYRAGYVRGDLDGGEQVAARCRSLLEDIRRVALAAAPLRARS
jgi:hypothetical protein